MRRQNQQPKSDSPPTVGGDFPCPVAIRLECVRIAANVAVAARAPDANTIVQIATVFYNHIVTEPDPSPARGDADKSKEAELLS